MHREVHVRLAHSETDGGSLRVRVPRTATVADLKAQIRVAWQASQKEALRLTCGGRELANAESIGSITGIVLCLLYDHSLAARGSKRACEEYAQWDMDMLPADWMDSTDPSVVLGWTFGILLTAVAACHIFSGEPCSRASLLMLGSMTVVYIALFLPQLKSCLALYPVAGEELWDCHNAYGNPLGVPLYIPPRPPAPLRPPARTAPRSSV